MSGYISRWKERFKYIGSRMFQTKKIDHMDMKTELRRCLSTVQLMFLGIGSTIGVGIYVLLGEIARNHAGPAVIVCFALAILITLMNALVYSELSSNVPQTGAAYTFFYKIFGEYPAFLCGWIMLSGYIMSASVGARAWSGMLDSFFNNSIQAYTTSVVGSVQFGLPFAEHLDFVALVFQITVTIIISCNIRCSSVVNSTLSILTTSVLVFVCITGIVFGDSKNFVNADHGGFLPFGISGLVKGTSLALYATSGFDIISMSAEEAKDPGKSIPRAIGLELTFVAIVYIGASVGMLFLIPYWMVDLRAPLPSAYEYGHLAWGKYIVTIGPLFGITNLQMLGLYGCSRVLYRMSCDNLFFSLFLKVSEKTGTPVNSIILAGMVISTFALLLDLSYLVSVTVLLMLISNMALGSALIKLKVSESEEYIRLDTLGGSWQEVEKIDTEFDKPYEPKENAEVDANGQVPLNPFISGVVDGTNSEAKNEIGETDLGDGFYFESDAGRTRITEGIRDEQFFAGMEQLTRQRMMANGDEIEIGNRDQDGNSREVTLNEEDFKDEDSVNEEDFKVDERIYSISQISHSFRAKTWGIVSPFVPSVISLNVLVFLHWASCMTLSGLLAYGWSDIVSLEPVAVIALCFLISALIVIMFLLWLQSTNRISQRFQTPLMPLVPTLAITGSSLLLFSLITVNGVLELLVWILFGSLLYIAMIWSDVEAQISVERDSEQMRSLVEHEDVTEDEM